MPLSHRIPYLLLTRGPISGFPVPADTVAGRAHSVNGPSLGTAADERGRGGAITGNRQASWAFADAFVAEDDALIRARARSHAAGLRPVSPGTGAALRLLAAAGDAKSVVEIGTGTGVSGIHLLRGMRPDGVLTTVDSEPDRQQLAREAYREAGFIGNRSRFICGRALDVLPRLTDGGYDLVHLDCGPSDHVAQFSQALRLVRPGGVVVISGVLRAEPEARTLLEHIGIEHGASCAVLPIGDGMLVMSTVSTSAK